MEELTDVISEIDITEQDLTLKSAEILNGKINPENISRQTENIHNKDGQKCQSSFGRDLSGITLDEDTKNLENVRSAESSIKEELSSIVLAAASVANTKIMPEFQFTEPSVSNEPKETGNSEPKSKKGEDTVPQNQDLNSGENMDELEEIGGNSQKTATSEKAQKPESTKKINRKFTILHDDDFSDNENGADVSMVSLLRSTICELERALRDSRALIKTRDEEIVNLRKEVEKGREQIHKEQLKWQRKCAVVDERGREIQELKKKLHDSEKTVEELSERIKEFESPCSESDDIVACCSSMKELLELKMKLVEKDAIIKEIRKNNPEDVLENAIVSVHVWKAKEKRVQAEADEHNQLKLKFLRDAFFYFMIDFHSEEQMKAILAVLSYGDQREDVIYQAYRMRQRGKKFTVKEVSSRELAFLHEEN